MSVNLVEEPSRAVPASSPCTLALPGQLFCFLYPSLQYSPLHFCFLSPLPICMNWHVLKPIYQTWSGKGQTPGMVGQGGLMTTLVWLPSDEWIHGYIQAAITSAGSWHCTFIVRSSSVLECVCTRGKKKLARGWVEIPNSFLPVKGDLGQWAPLWLIGQLALKSAWFASVMVKSGATCFFTSWIFRISTPDVPELKYYSAKSIFTSRGMASKNKLYPTCYPFLEN